MRARTPCHKLALPATKPQTLHALDGPCVTCHLHTTKQTSDPNALAAVVEDKVSTLLICALPPQKDDSDYPGLA